MPYVPLKRQEFQKELQVIKDNIVFREFNFHITDSNFSKLYNIFVNLETFNIEPLTFLNLKKEINKFFPTELSEYLTDNSSLLILKKIENFLKDTSIENLDELKLDNANSFKELSKPLEQSKIPIYIQKRIISSLIKHFDKKIMLSKNNNTTLLLPSPPLSLASLVDNPITPEAIDILTFVISLDFLDKYPKLKAKFENNLNSHGENNSKIDSIDSEKDVEELLEYRNVLDIISQENPTVLLALINNPISRDEAKAQRNFIRNSFSFLVDNYSDHYKPENIELTNNIEAAIYLSAREETAKKKFSNIVNFSINYDPVEEVPTCSFFIPERKKGLKSAQSNFNKEYKSFLKKITPTDIERGISLQELKSEFNPSKINGDFSAATLVLTKVEDTIHFSGNTKEEKELVKLRKERFERLKLIHSVENYIDDNTFISEEIYFQIYIELLKELKNSTFAECTKERINPQDPKSPYIHQELQNAIDLYEKNILNNSFSTLASEEEINNVKIVIEDLKNRLNDKFQDKMLDFIMPKILSNSLLQTQENPDLKKPEPSLGLQWKLLKDVKKPNGYCAKYYALIDPMTGLILELQVQTDFRYTDSKRGNSDHSTLQNKRPDIFEFFELVDPNENPDNLSLYLNILDNHSIGEINYLRNKTNLTSAQKRGIRQFDYALKAIKLKDKFLQENASGEITEQSLETYLKNFAIYNSPNARTIDSAHPTLGGRGASVVEKNLVECFQEVLLKSNKLSYLAQVLTDKLATFVPTQNISKTYTEESIRNYAEKRRNASHAEER